MAEHMRAQDQGTGLVERWKDTEPVRLWLYSVIVPVVALLVGYGLLSTHQAALWLAVAAGALLVGGTELARGFAVSPLTVNRVARTAASTPADSDEMAARVALIRHRVPLT